MRLRRAAGEDQDRAPLPDGSALLELDEVCASYGSYRALFGVTFEVKPGAIVALLGSNGAGKSTVARVVSGLVTASSGRITFNGPRHRGDAGLQDRPARHGATSPRAAASSRA